MKYSTILKFLILCLYQFSCENRGNKHEPLENDIKISQVKDTMSKVPPITPAATITSETFKISAHLVYDDGSLSAFDILNDKSIALWNIVAGGGDAAKASESIQISLEGKLHDLNVTVKNGSNLIEHGNFGQYTRAYDFVVLKTGCEKVVITVNEKNNIIYNDTIQFHCGE